MLTTLELFAGAGGAALGLKAAGCDALACVEYDTHACATLQAAGFPVVQADLRTWSFPEMGEQPELLWSSFPCQAFSQAGRRKGAEDDRNGWPWTLRIIDETEPTWFVAENVRGLTMHKKKRCGDPNGCPGCYLEKVILPDLRKRYPYVEAQVLNAADFGVPQHRRRLIIVAGPRPIKWPTPTHGPKGTLPYRTMGEALGVRCAKRDQNEPGPVNTRREIELTDGPPMTVPAKYDHRLGGQMYAIHPDAALDHGRNTEANPRQERPRPMTEPAPTIGGKGNQYLNQPAPTVTTTEVKGTRGAAMYGKTRSGKRRGGPDRASDALWLATGRRRLTVAEVALLQDFPADHPWQGTKVAQYRQVGNAVPPTLARVIAEAITEAHDVYIEGVINAYKEAQ